MDLSGNKLTELSFYLIVDASPNAVLVVNKEGKVAYVNRQCEVLFGYKAAELIGQTIEVLVPERFRGGHAGLRHGYSCSPTLRSMGAGMDLYALRRDGSEFPVEIGLNPLVLVDDTWVLTSVIDITERKLAEERFRKVVDSAPNAMILVSRQGRISLVNERATTLFGYDKREMLGLMVEKLVPERFRGHHSALRESFFASPQARPMGAGRDLVGLRRDGTEMPIELGLNPIETGDGIMVLASIIDITERKAQQDLRAKKEAAEAAFKAKGELLAVASHDLKNPLAAISGLAEVLLEMKKGQSNADHPDIEFLQNIYDASRHMSEIVKGILANEGLEQQQSSLAKERVDISALCEEIVRFNTKSAQRKELRLETRLEPGVTVTGDKTRLREAFDNYVSNAIKYSPPDRLVTVSLAVLPRQGRAEFGVRDQGPGLTEEDKAKLFGKFKRLSARPTGGEYSTGLGLSIVKTIVELHAGEVGCGSSLGQGAYFWARLPLS